MNLFYPNSCKWEEDFVQYDLFPDSTNILKYNKDTPFTFFQKYENMKNSIVIQDNFPYQKLLYIINYLKPKIIIILSDEAKQGKHLLELQNKCSLLLRQYNHLDYSYANNNYQIPLGYVKDFLNSKSSLAITTKLMKNRTISCSFIGQLKQDRLKMCQIFKNIFLKNILIPTNTNWSNPLQQKVTPQKLFSIYENSIFVLCGRGNVSLDCFRVYEAIIAGAIPVVVGNQFEIHSTFYYHNYPPKLITADTWYNAGLVCKKLIENKSMLQSIQDFNNQWWKQQINWIQQKIKDAYNSSSSIGGLQQVRQHNKLL